MIKEKSLKKMNKSSTSDLDLDSSFHSLVDPDEVKYKVIGNLNEVFGSDVKNLKKAISLVEELTKTKEQLEQRVSN